MPRKFERKKKRERERKKGKKMALGAVNTYAPPSIPTGFPGGSVVKNPLANAGDLGLTPVSGRSPGGRNDNPLQYSCLGNPMDRGDWWATVPGVTKESEMTEKLSTRSP